MAYRGPVRRTRLVTIAGWASIAVASGAFPPGAGASAFAAERAAPPAAASEPPPRDERSAREETQSGPTAGGRWGALGGVAGVYAAATTYMYFAWYHGQPDKPFRFGGDGYFGGDTYAGGADKLGHAWSNLAMSRVTSEVLAWGGWERWKAGLIASSLTLGLFTVFEVKDGFYTEFSPGDAAFNALGAAMNVAMLAYPPLDEAVDFRVEYFPSKEYRGLLRGARPPPDPAKPHQVSLNFVEDYSGQRYLFALHAHALPLVGRQRWARVVDVALGYEANGYKPEPVAAGVRRSQHLFLGVSVNVQGLLDLALAERDGPVASRARTTGHLVFELVNPPFGSAALVGATRSAR